MMRSGGCGMGSQHSADSEPHESNIEDKPVAGGSSPATGGSQAIEWRLPLSSRGELSCAHVMA